MKKILILAITFWLCTMPMTTASTSESTAYQISVNGSLIASDSSPVYRNGTVFAPMRVIFEALQAKVEYLPSEQKVIGTRGNTTLELQVGNKTAELNGEQLGLTQAPFIMNGRVYVPARLIGESLGAYVNWNQSTRTVEIESTLLPYYDKLPFVNDRNKSAMLEHNGQFELKWVYQSESPYEHFTGYAAGENEFMLAGFDEVFSFDKTGKITRYEVTKQSALMDIEATPQKKGYKITSNVTGQVWENIPLYIEEDGILSMYLKYGMSTLYPDSYVDQAGNLIITTTDGLSAYNAEGKQIWAHKEWQYEGKTVSALHEPYQMYADDAGRLYLKYWDHVLIVDGSGNLLAYIDGLNYGLRPLRNGLILFNDGISQLQEGTLQPLHRAAKLSAEQYSASRYELTRQAANSTDTEWSYKLPAREVNTGFSFSSDSITEAANGNVYLSTSGGTVHGVNSEGELVFKITINHTITSEAQILLLSGHEMAVIYRNVVLFFEID